MRAGDCTWGEVGRRERSLGRGRYRSAAGGCEREGGTTGGRDGGCSLVVRSAAFFPEEWRGGLGATRHAHTRRYEDGEIVLVCDVSFLLQLLMFSTI